MLGKWKLNDSEPRASLIQYHDTTHSPVALYQFNGDMLDSSGNGLHLSKFTGLERYTWLAPGLRCFFFDGETSLRRPGNDALLTITGALTIELIFLYTPSTFTGTFLSFGGGAVPARPATNVLYELIFDLIISWQRSTSSGAIFFNSTAATPDFLPIHYAVTRSSGASQIVKFYVNGDLVDTSGSLLAPTGGTSSRLWVGSDDNPLVTFDFMVWSMASLKIIPSELTKHEIKQECNRTVGHFYGWGA